MRILVITYIYTDEYILYLYKFFPYILILIFHQALGQYLFWS